MLRTFTSVVNVENPLPIYSDNGVQAVKSAAFEGQLSIDVQASLTVAIAQCMWSQRPGSFIILRDRSHLLTMDREQLRLAAKHRTP